MSSSLIESKFVNKIIITQLRVQLLQLLACHVSDSKQSCITFGAKGCSSAGKMLGLDDPRTSLIREVFRVVDCFPFLYLGCSVSSWTCLIVLPSQLGLSMNCYPQGAGGLREREEPLITQVASSLAFCFAGSFTFSFSSVAAVMLNRIPPCIIAPGISQAKLDGTVGDRIRSHGRASCQLLNFRI